MKTNSDKIFSNNLLNKKVHFPKRIVSFSNTISKDDPVFKPELNRYHLFISLGCPFAHRTLIARNLKGLQDVIGVTIVDWQLGNDGWKFSQRDGCTSDPFFGFTSVKDYYYKANSQYAGRFTVPFIWDKKTNTIVNNDSASILKIFNNGFKDLAKNSDFNLCPDKNAKEIEQLNDFIFQNINIGVYKAGYAITQDEYEEAFNKVFSALDKLEERLNKSRFLVGNTFTEADIRLFTTLIRFDAVYHGNFKCNRNQLKEFPNLSNYLREIYQMDQIKQTVDFKHIKGLLYSNRSVNPNGIIPTGPNLSYLDVPHTRNNLLKSAL
ncbi:hypothetical protein CYY_006217 [Polysphondylium violaceum]|uniref:GST C-terminal domain-containing protein n=1 Tax=Polysphondylium violaceum TaxID=133409 RepID=A0A8J4PRU7_9MYCE|nr:hypothetical protein CYY_006217 [Polysphondylium violaceum]